MSNVYYILFVAAITSFSTQIKAQATNQVSHILGNQTIAGTEVTVIPSGCRDVIYSYCPTVTSPYIVGLTLSPSNYCDGAYTFQFSPPVDSLTLNFSGVTNVQNHEEVVILKVNGTHYPLVSQGSVNSCDDYAIVDPNGNIAACEDCLEAGWKGTTIIGPISELSVKDSILEGFPGGSVFSLYINGALTGLTESSKLELVTFPNPFADQIKIESPFVGIISIFDMQGNKLLTVQSKEGLNAIDTKSLAQGTYFVKLMSDDGHSIYQKVVKI